MKKMGARLLIKMAWRNLWRQRRRTLITLFAMAAGLAFSIPTYGLMMGLRAQMIDGITGMHLGNIQVHEKKYPEERQMRQMLPAASLKEKILETPGVIACAPRAYSGGMVSAEKKFTVRLVGKPLDAISKIPVTHGRAPDRSKPCDALIDDETARKFKIRSGSMVVLTPMPPEGACEKIFVSGVFSQASVKSPTVFMATPSVQRILATPAKGKSQTTDDDDDDIDNLKKLDDKSPTTTIQVSTQLPGPDSGEYALLKLYSHPVGIIAVQPKDEAQVSTMSKGIIKGRYLSDAFKLEKSARGVVAQILIGEKLAHILRVTTGDIIGMDMGTVHNYALDRMFRVAGIFRTGLADFDRGVVYIHIGNAWDENLMGLVIGKEKTPAVHEFAIRTKKGGNNRAIASRIESQLPPQAMVRTWQQIEPSMANILNTQEAMTGLILAIILLIASFGTMNTMLMAVMERIKEFGVLKSIGMKPSWVGILIMTETFFLALTASITGGLLGVGIQSVLVTKGIDLSFIMPDGFSFQGVIIDPVWRATMTPRGLLIPVVLLFCISLLAAVWPAVRAARIKPVEAFRNQG